MSSGRSTPTPYVLARPGPPRAAAETPSPSSSSSPSSRAGRGRAADLLGLTRPGHWPKNLLVVPLPLLDPAVWHAGVLGRVLWALAAFTLASAVVYVLNDISDRDRDRRHPVKRHRPIAAGRVTVAGAWLYLLVLAAALAGLLWAGPAAGVWPVLAYLAMNAAYSRFLKHVPLIDVFVVASGFVLRVITGYAATGGRLAGWLLVCVFCVCLLLGLGKRRHELTLADAGHRPALRGYSLPLADALMVQTAALAAVAFLLYLRTEAPVGPHHQTAVLLSLPCALFGLFRYLQLVLVERRGGDPARIILHDRVMIMTALAGTALLAASLWSTHHSVLS